MILDYLRTTQDSSILIPPFHTGHLGFIPGTEVSLSLLSNFGQRESHCELFVTPFSPNLRTLCRLSCTMIDQPGAVNKLIQAVSYLSINVVKKESSGINYLNNHSVEMVLDWRTAGQYRDHVTTPPHLLARYQHLASKLPIRDYRYIELYESIIAHCGDIVLWDNLHQEPLPAITLEPFTGVEHEGSSPIRGRIESLNRTSFHVRLQVPTDLQARISDYTGHARGESLPYVLSSEASSRSLRVFFPRKNTVPLIVQAAFVHDDRPGALSAITRLIADAGFNILTGLLRKKTENRSGYEALLQYMRDEVPPQASPRDERVVLSWLKAKLESCDGVALADLGSFNVKVCTAEYPRPKERVSLDLEGAAGIAMSGPEGRKELSDLLAATKKRLIEKPEPRSDGDEGRLGIIQEVEQSISRKPRLFLSYPRAAKEHGEHLIAALQKVFGVWVELVTYQSPDFENIVQEVKRKIRSCDFFIGIWHHEERGSAGGGSGISPWMPFEYGIALEAGKEAIVIHSDKLPEEVWKRIDAGISKPGYSDLTFITQTVPMVVDYVSSHWVSKYRGFRGKATIPVGVA